MALQHQRPADLPAPLDSLRVPFYLHQTSPRVLRGALLVTASLALTALSFSAWRWSEGRAGAVEFALAVFAVPFLLVLLRPATWWPTIAFAADDQGLFFLGGRDSAQCTFVPWSEVGPITVERVTRGRGLSWMVVLPIATESKYWEGLRRSRFLGRLMASDRPPGFRRLVIGAQGVSAEKTRAALEELRGHSQSGRTARSTASRRPPG
jgi:hypothetical protein